MNPDNLFLYEGNEDVDPSVYFTYYLLCVEANMYASHKVFRKVQDLQIKLTLHNP